MTKHTFFISRGLFFLVTGLITSNTIYSQQLFRSEEILVTANGQLLQNAWAGGLNSCQFSTTDLNNDGKEDLFVFDRIGERVLCFLNTGGPGQTNYDHVFDYTLEFPDSLQNWALLRDYNCDGKEDIFTNYSSGMRLYENESTPDDLEFSLRSELTTASYQFSSTPFSAPVYCIGVDLPGIFDYDYDGDIDIITFTETAMTMYYYKNYGQELGWCDSLAYECVNRCYGKFHESPESFTLYLGEEAQCDFNVVDPREPDSHDEPFRHTGGTVCNIDLDQNGIQDLIIGDVTEPNLASLEMVDVENGQDSAVVVHMDFPATFSSTVPVEIQLFPGAFYEDVNNDGVRDLISSPNAFANAEDSLSCWLYINNGDDDLPLFEFVNSTFLQNTMIELGTGALPALADLSGDGLLDLVVSNIDYFSSDLEYTSKIWYFRNTGTLDNPAFELENDNYLSIPAHEWHSVYPAFGDLDNDGDIDLVLGQQDGLLHFFRNDAGVGAEAEFVLEMNPMTDAGNVPIDIGQFSTPQIIDMTGDDLPDLIVGEKNGNINLYENTGTPEVFSFTLVEDTIGNAVATNFLGINGYSVPHFITNADGDLELLLGTETGQINHYTGIENNLLSDFLLVTEDYGDIWEGDRSAVFTGDINGDDKMDLFLGNIGGGLAFYSGDTAEISVPELITRSTLRLYPNPASDSFTIQWTTSLEKPELVEIFDLTGRVVYNTMTTAGAKQMDVNVEQLARGSYVVRLGNSAIHFVKD